MLDNTLAAAKAALQRQLLALKAHYGPDLFHLHKGTGPDAPFPLIASLNVDKPAAAEAYDVFEALQVRPLRWREPAASVALPSPAVANTVGAA